MPPDQDWQAMLIAADWVIGDHGSVTLYATAAEVPVLLAAFAEDDVAPGSPIADLAAAAPRLRLDRPLEAQLHAAAAQPHERYEPIVRRITSEPGMFARNMRSLLYRLLDKEDPASEPRLPPIHPPHLSLGLLPGMSATCTPAAGQETRVARHQVASGHTDRELASDSQ